MPSFARGCQQKRVKLANFNLSSEHFLIFRPTRHWLNSIGGKGFFLFGIAVALGVTFGSVLDAQADNPKRGWAGSELSKVNGLNTGWFYDWGQLDYDTAGTDAEYVPMFYSASHVTPASVANASSYSSEVTHILGMNEPDQPSQGTSTVAEALAVWPQIESTGLRTVSPANLTDPGGLAWTDSFLTQAENLGYRVDVVAFHWYRNHWSVDYNNPQQTASAFLDRIDWFWNTYQKPLWITEFGIRDTSNMVEPELIQGHNEEFLEIVLPALDALTFVERYAWFQWEHDLRLINGNPLTPTRLGEVYADALRPGETLDLQGESRGDDVIYMRGGVLTNSAASVPDAMGHLDVLASQDGEVGQFLGGSDWGMVSGTFRVREGGTVLKRSANEITLQDTTITNDGLIQVSGGTLRVNGATQFLGTGQFDLLPGGELALGQADDPAGVNLRLNLQLKGGTISSQPTLAGRHILTGTHALSAETTFDVAAALEVNGLLQETAAGAGIRKTGVGRLSLTAATSFTGDVYVEAGTLELGTAAGLDQVATIHVAADAILDATARQQGLIIGAGRTLTIAPDATVDGQLTISDGGTLQAAGTITSDLVAQAGALVRRADGAPAELEIGGSLLMHSGSKLELQIDDTTNHDSVQVGGNFTAGGILEVTTPEASSLLEAGDSFPLLQFGEASGTFAELILPELAAGLIWNASELLTNGILSIGLVGDYNNDGIVDAADYSVWRDHMASGAILPNDSTPESTSTADYLQWKQFYGATLLSSSAMTTVPEPASAPCMWGLIIAFFGAGRSRLVAGRSL